jgi:hypothetical protein
MKSSFRTSAFSLLLALFAAVPVAAQSTLATAGLGVPVEPQDARARGLGGVDLGYAEPEISWANPAGVAGLIVPGMIVSYQYDNFTVDGGAGSGSTARLPLLLAAFPASERLVFQAGVGTFLDQNWRFERADTLVLGQDTVAVQDIVSSDGGVTRLRIAAAYNLIPGLGLGLALDRYAGDVERIQGRVFPGGVVPECCQAVWTYAGTALTAGAQWTPSQAAGFGASITLGGTLEASPRDAELDPIRSYELPVQLRVGGTGHVAANLLVALAANWAGWSSLDEAFAAEGGARDSWSVHGGLEWDGITVRERLVPLRLGARTATLPFGLGVAGGDGPVERALTAGGGAILAGGAVRTDTSFELGSRSAGVGLDESFWRFGISVRVLGR